MKKLLLAGVTLGALIAPAVAADMALKAPVPLQPSRWSGIYIGLNAGYDWNSQSGVSTAATPTADAALGVVPGVSEGLASLSSGTIPAGSRGGFIGGGQIGINRQFGSFVAGIETDIQGIAESGGANSVTTTAEVGLVPVTSTLTATKGIDYLGTVRLRGGFLLTPTLLAYGTFGLAYGGVNATTTLSQSGTNGFVGTGNGTFSDLEGGWVVGGGLEWMLARYWSAKLEYLHYDLGNASFSSTASSGFFATPIYQNSLSTARFQGELVRAGVNFHF